ncbi:MAG: hypothetical protein ACTSQP_20340 [Promethearchaeota archaeon]
MLIEYKINQNIFLSKTELIVKIVICFGVMGKGLVFDFNKNVLKWLRLSEKNEKEITTNL